MVEIICKNCGKAFYFKKDNQKYCSRVCMWEVQRKERKEKSETKRKRFCEMCGKEFIMNQLSGKGYKGEIKEGRFCSRKCRSQQISKQSMVGKFSKIYARYCVVCGKAFITKHSLTLFCSLPCSIQHHQQKRTPHRTKEITCKTCGIKFIPKYRDKRRLFCSDVCLKHYTRDGRKAKEKARDNGVYYEYINSLKVFMRDGWRCQLCNKKLNPKHRGTYRDDAPELDHIIPWANGGEHSYRNTQCACRKCNREKGAQSYGQLRLFG